MRGKEETVTGQKGLRSRVKPKEQKCRKARKEEYVTCQKNILFVFCR